jgi:hypothetical protein
MFLCCPLLIPTPTQDFNLPGRTDYLICHPASEEDIRKTVTPPGAACLSGCLAGVKLPPMLLPLVTLPATLCCINHTSPPPPGVTVAKALPKPRVALTVGNGQCNIGMPANVFDRFLWVIKLYAQAGFKVVIDNHVWLEDPTGGLGVGDWVDVTPAVQASAGNASEALITKRLCVPRHHSTPPCAQRTRTPRRGWLAGCGSHQQLQRWVQTGRAWAPMGCRWPWCCLVFLFLETLLLHQTATGPRDERRRDVRFGQ